MSGIKRNRFLIFLTIYGFLLCLAGAFAMRYLWLFLEEYEAVLPEKSAAQYEQEHLQERYEKALDDYARRHATAFQDAQQIRSFLDDTLAGKKLSMKKEKTEGSDGNLHYAAYLDELQIGRVSLELEALENSHFGMKQYVPGESVWKLPGEYSEVYSVTAPVGAQIRINGVLLSPENAVCRKIPAQIPKVAKAYGEMESCCYEFRYYGRPSPEVFGREDCVYFLQEDQNAFTVSAIFTEEACPEQRELAENFVSAFIAYGAKKCSMASVLKYVVYGTSLFTRISSATSGLYWAVGGNYRLENFETEQFLPFGKAVICDTAYDICDPSGNMIKSGMRLLMVQERETWKVFDIEMR